MVGEVVGLELAVVGVLDVDGLVAYVGRGGGVVVDHGDGRLFGSHFYKSLVTQRQKKDVWKIRVNTEMAVEALSQLLCFRQDGIEVVYGTSHKRIESLNIYSFSI